MEEAPVMETKHCDNCKKDVPVPNYLHHSIHCPRNIRLCPKCDEPYPIIEMDAHIAEDHVDVVCPQCYEFMEAYELASHQSDSCLKRMVSCLICEVDLPADSLLEHIDYCGSRSDRCDGCGKTVLMKYRAFHLSTRHRLAKPDTEAQMAQVNRQFINQCTELSRSQKSAQTAAQTSSQTLYNGAISNTGKESAALNGTSNKSSNSSTHNQHSTHNSSTLHRQSSITSGTNGSEQSAGISSETGPRVQSPAANGCDRRYVDPNPIEPTRIIAASAPAGTHSMTYVTPSISYVAPSTSNIAPSSSNIASSISCVASVAGPKSLPAHVDSAIADCVNSIAASLTLPASNHSRTMTSFSGTPSNQSMAASSANVLAGRGPSNIDTRRSNTATSSNQESPFVESLERSASSVSSSSRVVDAHNAPRKVLTAGRRNNVAVSSSSVTSRTSSSVQSSRNGSANNASYTTPNHGVANSDIGKILNNLASKSSNDGRKMVYKHTDENETASVPKVLNTSVVNQSAPEVLNTASNGATKCSANAAKVLNTACHSNANNSSNAAKVLNTACNSNANNGSNAAKVLNTANGSLKAKVLNTSISNFDNPLKGKPNNLVQNNNNSNVNQNGPRFQNSLFRTEVLVPENSEPRLTPVNQAPLRTRKNNFSEDALNEYMLRLEEHGLSNGLSTDSGRNSKNSGRNTCNSGRNSDDLGGNSASTSSTARNVIKERAAEIRREREESKIRTSVRANNTPCVAPLRPHITEAINLTQPTDPASLTAMFLLNHPTARPSADFPSAKNPHGMQSNSHGIQSENSHGGVDFEKSRHDEMADLYELGLLPRNNHLVDQLTRSMSGGEPRKLTRADSYGASRTRTRPSNFEALNYPRPRRDHEVLTRSELRGLNNTLDMDRQIYNHNVEEDAALCLPCEFCDAPIPMDHLILHQTGCRPDLIYH